MGNIGQGMSITDMEAAQAEMRKVMKGIEGVAETVEAFIVDTKDLNGYVGKSLETALEALNTVKIEVAKATEAGAQANKVMTNFIEDTKMITEDHTVRM